MATKDRGVASLQSLAAVSRILIWIFVASLLLCVIPTLAVLAREMRLADPPVEIIAVSALAGVLYLVAFLLAAVPITLWIYRAHANLRGGGGHALDYSPGWAVGSFFVPLANLVVPLKAMRELHNRSLGGLPEWSQSSVGSVTSWWACHISAVLIWGFLTFITILPLLTNIFFTTPPAANTALTLMMLALLAGSALYMLKIIGEVTQAQVSGTFAARVFE